jgi:RNA polymerase sigma factor (sigma-70 family)
VRTLVARHGVSQFSYSVPVFTGGNEASSGREQAAGAGPCIKDPKNLPALTPGAAVVRKNGRKRMEDSQIIDLYFDRDETAISETDLKYGHYCGTIAWGVLRNREDSEECVNDTWWKAWNAIPPARPDILSAFLGKITRNLALHMYEKNHALRRGEGEIPELIDELGEVLAAKDSTEDEAIQSVEESDLSEAINDFLGKLRGESRIIFLRRYFYMDSVEKIASLLNSTEGKVKMSLLRSREKLKKYLEKRGLSA